MEKSDHELFIENLKMFFFVSEYFKSMDYDTLLDSLYRFMDENSNIPRSLSNTDAIDISYFEPPF
jgi:hypothetical protein